MSAASTAARFLGGAGTIRSTGDPRADILAAARAAAEKAAKEEEAAAAAAKAAEEAKAAEAARLAAEAKVAEEARLAAEAKVAEEARLAAEAKTAEEARLAAEAKAAEEARLAAEAKAAAEVKAAEEARLAAEAKAAEDARLAAAARAAEAAATSAATIHEAASPHGGDHTAESSDQQADSNLECIGLTAGDGAAMGGVAIRTTTSNAEVAPWASALVDRVLARVLDDMMSNTGGPEQASAPIENATTDATISTTAMGDGTPLIEANPPHASTPADDQASDAAGDRAPSVSPQTGTTMAQPASRNMARSSTRPAHQAGEASAQSIAVGGALAATAAAAAEAARLQTAADDEFLMRLANAEKKHERRKAHGVQGDMATVPASSNEVVAAPAVGPLAKSKRSTTARESTNKATGARGKNQITRREATGGTRAAPLTKRSRAGTARRRDADFVDGSSSMHVASTGAPVAAAVGS